MGVINFSGIASGIDSTALIEAQSESLRQSRIEPNQTKVDEYTETSESLKELNTRLTSLRSELDNFTTLRGGGINKLVSSNDESIVSATSTGQATTGNIGIEVIRKARNGIISFGDRYSGDSVAIVPSFNNSASVAARTLTITIGQGTSAETVSIVLDDTTKLTDFVSEFNSKSSKASANLVNVGTATTPSYALRIVSNKTGTVDGQIAIQRGSEFSNAGNLTTNTLLQAESALLRLDGISGNIERQTNSVNDIVQGVTFELNDIGIAKLDVSVDPDATVTKIQKLIDSYNDLVDYINEGDTIDQEEDESEVSNIFGPLARSNIDESILSNIRTEISGTRSSNGSEIVIFPDIGITTNRQGKLDFNAEKFKEALAKEPSSVDEMLTSFSDDMAKTGGVIDNFTRFKGIIGTSISSNEESVRQLNRKIAEIELYISRQEETLRLKFARLEGLIGQMQSQQSSLSSALAGLNS
jgi:flagellar hook-associated protein 2